MMKYKSNDMLGKVRANVSGCVRILIIPNTNKNITDLCISLNKRADGAVAEGHSNMIIISASLIIDFVLINFFLY